MAPSLVRERLPPSQGAAGPPCAAGQVSTHGAARGEAWLLWCCVKSAHSILPSDRACPDREAVPLCLSWEGAALSVSMPDPALSHDCYHGSTS